MMRIIEMKLNGGINLMKIESSSGISSIKCFENSMMVGRNDGVIELYENN